MKRVFLLFTTAICAFLMCGCNQKRDGSRIYPLSPFTDAIVIKDKPAAGQEYVPEIKTQYYIVDEATDLTDRTRIMLENYIQIHLKKDIATNKAIYFTFYKG